MEKKRRIFSGLIAALVVITLVSCCFVGVTFARYTSSYRGSATVGVAKWDITFTGAGASDSADITFADLSPSKDAYGSTARTHPTEPTLVATITNNSDVSADVTVTVGKAENFYLQESGDPFDFTGQTYSSTDLEGIFTVALFSDEHGTQALTTKTLAKGGNLTIYAVVTWNSDVGGKTGAEADARDTWIGENIAKIAYTISYTAVQATEMPATT